MEINEVRKHKGVFLACELLGTIGVNLTNCGNNTLEVSSIRWLPIKDLKGNCDTKGDRVKTSSFKA